MNIRNYLKRLYGLLYTFLYRRTRYRLFLKTSIEGISARTRQLVAVTDYFAQNVTPIPITAPFGESMLVIAPHQDDETIGCGGAIALQAMSGKPVAIIILQDGGDEHEPVGLTREQLIHLRNGESSAAAAVIGIEEPTFLSLRSLRQSHRAAAEAVARQIRDRQADAIFTPFVLDNHPDHLACNMIVAEALRGLEWPVRVFGYEVWGLSIPNVVVNIDSVIDRKIEMLECFHYANQAVDYTNSTVGLNMYRSRLLASGQAKYLECFFEVPSAEFVELMAKVDL